VSEFEISRERNASSDLGCIIIQTKTTAHQLSFSFHHPLLWLSQAGTDNSDVTIATLKANLISKP
jgi:hypothetical protein